ncbi:hypothetical protein ACFE04_028274 [Oxalis oulophora]
MVVKDKDSEVETSIFRLITDLDKYRNANREKELEIIMLEGCRNIEVIDGLQLEDLKDLNNIIDKAIEHIDRRLELMAKTNNEASSSMTSTIRAPSPTLEETSEEFDDLTANNKTDIAFSSSAPSVLSSVNSNDDSSDDADSDLSDEVSG